MTGLKCPFCQQELDYLAEDIYGSRVCPNCHCLGWVLHGNDSMWEELERTKKKLDIAVDALKELRPTEKRHCCLVPTVFTTQRIIDEALKQINQKDE